jgi:hypothetical protein
MLGLVLGSLAVLALVVWATSRAVEELVRPEPLAPVTLDEPTTPPTAHITATLFYAGADGQTLVPIRREVPLAADVVAQGVQILTAQLAPPPDSHVTVIPPGTALRAFYVTPRGDAFVDLSPNVSSAHPGGSLTELLTIYTIVNAITANLPAVRQVQILVDGREVDTIAGHVDIRRPLTQELSLVGEAPGAP